MTILTDHAVTSLSQGKLKNLLVFLALISAISWGAVVVTTIIRTVTHFAYKRPRIDE